ncbi:MAG TPA: hypothetical protein VFX71_02355 [Hyphomicrobium sp.]|nr:hypothetical protein [Hyphomicrobium sp.]
MTAVVIDAPDGLTCASVSSADYVRSRVRKAFSSVPNTIKALVRCCFSFSAFPGARSHEQCRNDPDGKRDRNNFDNLTIHHTTRSRWAGENATGASVRITDTEVECTMKTVSMLKANKYSSRNSRGSFFKCQRKAR